MATKEKIYSKEIERKSSRNQERYNGENKNYGEHNSKKSTKQFAICNSNKNYGEHNSEKSTKQFAIPIPVLWQRKGNLTWKTQGKQGKLKQTNDNILAVMATGKAHSSYKHWTENYSFCITS